MSDSAVTGSEFLTRHGVTSGDWRAWCAEAQVAAGRLKLVFARELRGAAGGMTGSGSGVSIDFKDHRRYLPGDDPRHINWQAYARTGHPVLKVFHEEVSPRADVFVDLSGSHAHEKEKLSATLRLALFTCFSAKRGGASVRLWLARGESVASLDAEAFRMGKWEPPATTPGGPESVAPAWHRAQWRARSLRVLVTDLLFPGEPDAFLAPLCRDGARTVVFCPYSKSECDPDWTGHVALTDCETGERRERRAGEVLKQSYLEAYRRHFTLWDESCRRRGATLARVSCSESLSVSLAGTPARLGVVEPC